MKAKKALPVLLLTLALLALALLLPAAASAQSTEPIDFLMPPAYGSTEAANPTNMNELLLDQAFEDYRGRLPSAAAGDTLWMYFGWFMFTRGAAQTAPNYVLETIEIWKQKAGAHEGAPDITITPQQARAFWWGADLVDTEFWVTPPVGFNPKIGAKIYVNWWVWEMLPLEAGDYTVHWQQAFKHPRVDLWGGFYGNVKKPYTIRPGDPYSTVSLWSWFTVTQ
jgi:hypothetical protein